MQTACPQPSAADCNGKPGVQRLRFSPNRQSVLTNDAKRIPVLADTTLLRTLDSCSAARLAHSPPTRSFLLCCTQMWMQNSGQAFPSFARTVLEYLGKNIHYSHQISLAQFSAYHLREIIFHLDMLAIARTTKLTATSKENVGDETSEHVHASGSLGETDFYGGEQTE